MRILVALLCAFVLIGWNEGKSQPILSQAAEAGGWTITSQGVRVSMQFNGFYYFDIPQAGNVNYIYKAGTVSLGQTITLKFAIEGTGSLFPVDAADIPPAAMRLFIAGNPSGISPTRWWCPTSKTNLTPGEHTATCIVSAQWTSVGGGMPDPGPPANIQYVGYTLGGQYFAGHGVRSQGGNKLVIKEYTIQ